MKYISLDTETTGLPGTGAQLLEIGAVIDSTLHPQPIETLPRFHCYVLPREGENYLGHPFALSLNYEILRQVAGATYDQTSGHIAPNGTVCLHYNNIADAFERWVDLHFSTQKLIPVAGKNIANFDMRFLEEIPGFNIERYRRRTIDPTTLFFRPTEDPVMPDTQTCMRRAGIASEIAHTAIEDAEAVIRMLRHIWA